VKLGQAECTDVGQISSRGERGRERKGWVGGEGSASQVGNEDRELVSKMWRCGLHVRRFCGSQPRNRPSPFTWFTHLIDIRQSSDSGK
jgi:hypothetical protein